MVCPTDRTIGHIGGKGSKNRTVIYLEKRESKTVTNLRISAQKSVREESDLRNKEEKLILFLFSMTTPVPSSGNSAFCGERKFLLSCPLGYYSSFQIVLPGG